MRTHTSYVLTAGSIRRGRVLPYVVWSNLTHRMKLTYTVLKQEKNETLKTVDPMALLAAKPEPYIYPSFGFILLIFHWLSEAF